MGSHRCPWPRESRINSRTFLGQFVLVAVRLIVRVDPPHLKVSFSWFFMFIDVILSCFLRNQFSWQNGQFVPKACRHFLKAIVVRVSYRTRVRSLVMRQCQIRVRFESRGMQFFKVLKKWFWMTKYVPIIVLWCSERGFYKKVTWSPVLGVLPMPQITWQC